MKLKYILSLAIASTSFTMLSCGGGDNNGTKEVNVNPVVTSHELSDAQMLNPINYSDAGAGYILSLSLIHI